MFEEKDCWNFLADNMAPFTSGASAVVEQSDSSQSDFDSTGLVQSFIKLLARSIQTLDTYEV